MKIVYLCWREIFDPQTLKIFTAGTNIQNVNDYTHACTNCKYFIFNGLGYESHNGYFDKVDIVIMPDENFPEWIEHTVSIK